jgi:hypothetical protein
MGYPGEGPTQCSTPWGALRWVDMTPEHPFITRSRSVLTGVSPGRGLMTKLVDGASDETAHEVMMALAESGNSTLPVAARFQSRPANLRRLAPPEATVMVSAAERGVAYRFSSRPCQRRAPKPFQLAPDEEEAVSAEVQRLHEVCSAIEPAPEHDHHKALLRGQAQSYELQDFPEGPWPRRRRCQYWETIRTC